MPESPHIVSDVMTLTVVTVGPDATFKEMVRTLELWKVSAMPVVDRAGRVIGVVSEADLLPKEALRDRGEGTSGQLRHPAGPEKAAPLTAGELMTSPAVTVAAGAPLAQAARIMALNGVKRLPVVDDEGRLQGIVSRGDLLRVFLRSDDDIEEEVRRTVVSYLFPAFSSSVRVRVNEGVVTLSGHVRDTTLIWVAARLVRAVEGVVDVECRLTGASRAS